MPTALHRLDRWARETPGAPAQRHKQANAWVDITAGEFRDRVYHLALFLESRGMTPGDIGTILSPNCPQWVHLELAFLLLGAKAAGLYPNSTPRDIRYVLGHTGSRFLGVRDRDFFAKILDGDPDSSITNAMELVIVFDGDTSISPKAVSYDAAIAEGATLAARPGAKRMDDYLRAIDPMAGAFMIYTSGTTGNPKGAVLSHDNLIFTTDIAAKHWNLPFGRGTLFSFLPLCHIAEALQNIGVGISQRYAVTFCTKFDNVLTEIVEVQPSLVLCVPRVWEKMMEGVLKKVDSSPRPRRALAHWALGVGQRVSAARFSGRRPALRDRLLFPVADRLVLSKVRHALGLGRAEVLASGAAALPAHVSRWFRSLQLDILEDFGQTESTGVICMTVPGVEMAGTVGRPVEGIEFAIADDGEILTRGRHVFTGYFKDEAATAAALSDGWLHTGDLAVRDEQGLVRINGRKKEILKTSGGKMVAPLPIEEQLKAAPIISQVCMVGDGRKYLCALITPTESTLADLKKAGHALDGVRLEVESIVSAVKQYISELNASLPSYAQIKRFTLLAREFSIAEGEMTPTLKMKRNVIEARYRQVIDEMYQGAGAD